MPARNLAFAAALLPAFLPATPAAATAPGTTAAAPHTAPATSPSQTPAPIILAVNHAETLPGVTRPERAVTLGTPFDGLVSEVRVEEGQRIRKGDIVAVLDDRVSRAALRVSECEADHTAAVIRAQAVYDRAKQSLDRTKAAMVAGAISDEHIAEAQNRHDIAAADLRFAKETAEKADLQLELTRAQLEQHHIRAPFDAIAVRVHASPGEVLSPDQPIADIVSQGMVHADLYIEARAAFALRPGNTVALRLEAPFDAVLPATVVYVEPRIDPIAKAARVVFRFNETIQAIPAGIFVRPAQRLPDTTDLAALAGFSELLAPRPAASDENTHRTAFIIPMTH